MTLSSFGITDIGPSRPNNEDVWTALPEIGFFALADGMGGHLAGEIAAQEAIDHLCASIKKLKPSSPSAFVSDLRHAIEKANLSVFRLGQKNESYNGMGTTLCCLMHFENTVVYAHVGDSRIYRMRDGKLSLLTQDHSLYAKWQSYGKESQTPFPYKNVITKAIGTAPKSDPEIASAELLPGDLFLLCSDGLSDVLTLEELEGHINTAPDLPTKGHLLIKAAKIKGSSDNMTLILIQSGTTFAKNLSGQQRDDGARSEVL